MTTGYDRLIAWTTGQGLGIPPAPSTIRSEVERLDRVLFATTAIDRFELYEPWHRLEKLNVDRPETIFAVGHAGHGVNSYAVGYILVFRGAALLAYTGWGGVYQDNEAAAARCANRFAKLTPIVAALETRADSSRDLSILCIADFLGVCAVGRWADKAESNQATPQGWVEQHQVQSEVEAFEAMLDLVHS